MIDAILNYISSLFSGVVTWFGGFFQDFLVWLLSILTWFGLYLINSILEMIQYLVLLLVVIANGAINLLPVCSIPTIDLLQFQETYNKVGSTFASAVAWILPVDFLIIAVGCLIQAVMAYLMISWMLRWLKVIK